MRRVMILGAPFEADAQLVQLQKQGLIDVIMTEDADPTLLGASLVQFGYKKRSARSAKQYFDGNFPLVTLTKRASVVLGRGAFASVEGYFVAASGDELWRVTFLQWSGKGKPLLTLLHGKLLQLVLGLCATFAAFGACILFVLALCSRLALALA